MNLPLKKRLTFHIFGKEWWSLMEGSTCDLKSSFLEKTTRMEKTSRMEKFNKNSCN